MVGIEEINWVLKHGLQQERLTAEFLKGNPLLTELPKVAGWTGAKAWRPDGTIATRGRAYAVRLLSAEAIMAQGDNGPRRFQSWVNEQVYEMGAALGKITEACLRGDGSEKQFSEIQADARMDGTTAVGTFGIDPLKHCTCTCGMQFMHLGALPHVAIDDGTLSLRCRDYDGVEIRVRAFGNVVPVGTVIE